MESVNKNFAGLLVEAEAGYDLTLEVDLESGSHGQSHTQRTQSTKHKAQSTKQKAQFLRGQRKKRKIKEVKGRGEERREERSPFNLLSFPCSIRSIFLFLEVYTCDDYALTFL